MLAQIAASFGAGELSGACIARTLIAGMLRADPKLPQLFGHTGSDLVRELGVYDPDDFSEGPSINVWTSGYSETPGAGVELVEVSTMVTNRWWEDSVEPLAAWTGGLDTLVHHERTILDRDKGQLIYRAVSPALVLAKDARFRPFVPRIEAKDGNRVAMRCSLEVTHKMTLDPDTRQIFALAVTGSGG